MAEFKTLEQIFNMVSPADLSKKIKLSLGTPEANPSENAFRRILSEVLESSTKGLASSERIKNEVEGLATPVAGVTKVDTTKLGEFFKLYSSAGFFGFAPESDKTYTDATGVNTKSISGVSEIIGSNVKIPATKQFGALLLNAPFIAPATRNTGMVDVFLNSMPPIVANRMTPYLAVEFYVPRESSPQIQSFGQLKFLLGAPQISSLGSADKATFEGSVTKNSLDQKESFVAGMEMFTSPQTMIDPQPNSSIGVDGNHYAPIMDPFRPFASLESAEVTIVPAVGTFCYKKAKLTLKLHDKSRLSEISDFIRPRVYSGITIWLEYGWRVPDDLNDPYAEYINKNLQSKEAYGIINSNFSFDKVGQVQITLELFTKGVSELRQTKITDGLGSARSEAAKLKQIADRIYELRKRLKLDPPEGLNKEIRVYQLLDAAQSGESPNFKKEEISTLINQLQEGMNKRPMDKAAANQLVEALREFYNADSVKTDKFDYKQRFENTVASSIIAKFAEVASGPDPFLPDASKGSDAELVAEIAKYKAEPLGETKTFKKSVVSFAKVFATFVVPSILTEQSDIDELQIFTYQMNEQCGLMSMHNIAEFPIDMKMFADQYKEVAVSSGGEMMTVEAFLGLLINAQFLDDKAIGYGLRNPTLNPSKPQVQKDPEGKFESALANSIARFGGWKKPAIEMYIEVAMQRVDDSLPAAPGSAEQQKLRKIMRIHVYDKQLNPYNQPASLLRSEDGTGFIERPSTTFAQSQQFGKLADIKVLEGVREDITTGKVSITSITSNRQIKDIVSKMIPTITVGANGSTVMEANLSSKNDPLLSTVNMTRSMTVKNSASPNGMGETGLPLRVIPATLSLTTMGCPLAQMAQFYFIDFNTGTTLDNLYIVTGLTHAMAPGKFETSWQFGYADGYGRYEGAPNIVEQLTQLQGDIKD